MPHGKVRALPPITQARLKELVVYETLTGSFRWALARPGVRVGAIAGCAGGPNGSVVIRLDRQLYLAHRLAWLYMTGEWPEPEVDHRDGDEGNNVWTNLREATRSEQLQNTRDRPNSSGYRGVSRFRDRWQACICINGKRMHLGHFTDPAEAHAAYLSAKARLHPFQPVPRDIGM